MLDKLTLVLHALSLQQGLYKPSPVPTTNAQQPALNYVAVPDQPFQKDPADIGVGSIATPHALDTQHDACYVEPYPVEAPALDAFPPFDPVKANIFRYRQQQSVNLGSWFVHEQWMTPSLFTCANGTQLSELDIAQGWNSTDNARALLERHWDTFITATDFQYLASIGINTVRLPIGYWSLGPAFTSGTPFQSVSDVYANSWQRVVRAINLAGEAGLGVLVDMHGAVGSQNGQAHSGVSDGQTQLFGDEGNKARTIEALSFLVQQLSSVTNVVGVQLLNEPQNVPELPAFYDRAIQTLRQISPTIPLYIHDGFNLEQFSDYVSKRVDFVVQDNHSYFVFTSEDATESASDHTNDVQTGVAERFVQASTQERRNLIIGEWSCALTPDSLSGEQDADAARRDFCTHQMDVYTNSTAGWAFWAYRTEDCDSNPGWCFRDAVGRSLPSSFFSYGQPGVVGLDQANPYADAQRGSHFATTVGSMVAPPMSDILGKLPLAARDVHTAHVARRFDPSLKTYVDLARMTQSFGGNSRHRFEAIHLRRSERLGQSGTHANRDLLQAATGQPSDEQASFARGYGDGYLTAKAFALEGGSRLGFKGQYVMDSMANLVAGGTQLGTGVTPPDGAAGGIVAPGTEERYRDGFYTGLQDGEAAIKAVMATL
ncbi:glycoside hydrolase superfamily [Schizophyllum amplum]|uniref:Glycoside hydrolase superfamily n=1 Tax=Schizophyllum amplum TaxID=97359 RepID=A0A550D090_9AGAR|nr:glycoside hydrolase superfamily [Auriculariopsis ampla]